MAENTTAVYKLPYPSSTGNVSATPADLLELNERLEAVIKARAEASFETGDIKASLVATASTGWLLCEGQAISRITYAKLFAAIGVSCGPGDGSTTFNIPDGRNASWVGAYSGSGPAWFPGGKGGSETIQLSGSQTGTPAHIHGAEEKGRKVLVAWLPGALNASAAPASSPGVTVGQGQSPETLGPVAPGAGGGYPGAPMPALEAHENMPP
jgi:microcystin-dependent protein